MAKRKAKKNNYVNGKNKKKEELDERLIHNPQLGENEKSDRSKKPKSKSKEKPEESQSSKRSHKGSTEKNVKYPKK